MKKLAVRRSGLALVMMAAALAGLGAAPSAEALAPGLDPGNRLGELALDKTSGAISAEGGPQRLTTDAGCPEGYRGSSRALWVWSDGTWPLRVSSSDSGLPAAVVVAGASNISGLDGTPIVRENVGTLKYASRWAAGGFPPSRFDGHSGVATYLITCDPGAAPGTTFPSATEGVGSSKYFSVDIRITWDDATDTGTWEVADGTPIEKDDTTTTLTPTARNDGSVTLTAALSPAVATGEVTFTDVATGASVGTATVQGGSAAVSVSGLRPDTAYTFRAAYAGDSRHNPSTSNDAVVTTVGQPVPPEDTDISVTIPAANTDLQLTVATGGASLGTAFRENGVLVAHGELGDVSVRDNRAVKGGWSVNGQAGALVSSDDPTRTIPASALGWQPRGVNGTPGSPVEPGENGGLSTPKVLGSLPVGSQSVLATFGAQIELQVPQTTTPGAYTSTLTITLL